MSNAPLGPLGSGTQIDVLADALQELNLLNLQPYTAVPTALSPT